MAATMWGPSADSRQGEPNAYGSRKDVIKQLPDAEAVMELRERVAEADSSQSWFRNRVDAWRRWHNEHYTPGDRQAAAQQWVSGGAGAPDQLAPAEPQLPDMAINGIAEEFVEKYRETGLEARFVPRSRATPSENVAVMNGIMRRIDADGGAAAIEINAFREALLYGYACIAYEVGYAVDDVDPDADVDLGAYDLVLKPREIERAEWTVLWDPGCKRLDKSDAEWCAIRTWMTREKFVRQYPRAAGAGTGGPTIGSGGGAPNVWPRVTADIGGGDPWYKMHGGEDLVQVVDYYRKTYKPARIELDEHGQAKLVMEAPGEDAPAPAAPAAIPDPMPGGPGMRSTPMEDELRAPKPTASMKPESPRGKHRKLDVCRVEHIVACGDFVLDRTEVPGNVIPVIPLYGHRMVSETEGVWHHGLIYLIGDAVKASENISSQATGMVARAAKVGFLVPQGGTDADEEAWATLHTINRNFVPYSTTPPGGPNSQQPPLPAPIPVPSQIQIDGQLNLLRHFQEQIARRSGTLDVPATQDSAHDRSAQSIVRLNAIGQSRNELYARNMATITLKRKGQVLARMIPAVYDRPGRLAWVKGADPGDKDRPVYLGAPFVEGDGDDGPMLIPADQRAAALEAGEWSDPAAPPGPDGQPAPPKRVHNIDLRKGVLDAETHIGSREKASRSESVNTLSTLLGQEGVFGEQVQQVAAAQMVAILSADLPELLPVYRKQRETISALHEDEDMGREAVMSRLTDAQTEIAQKDEQIAQLQAEADKLRTVENVASMQAQSGIEKEALRGQTAVVVEGIRQEGAAQGDERKAGAALELAALKAAFEERLARMQGQIDLLHTGFEKGLEGAEAAAEDVKDTGTT